MGQLSNIITRWRHQTLIKEREIKVYNCYQKAVKKDNTISILENHAILQIH